MRTLILLLCWVSAMVVVYEKGYNEGKEEVANESNYKIGQCIKVITNNHLAQNKRQIPL